MVSLYGGAGARPVDQSASADRPGRFFIALPLRETHVDRCDHRRSESVPLLLPFLMSDPWLKPKVDRSAEIEGKIDPELASRTLPGNFLEKSMDFGDALIASKPIDPS
jgi:hypothetical protein